MSFIITMSLSKQDYALLAQLDTNARQTYIQLGKKLRMNKDTVKYRMERLQKLGIIQGYYTELNTQLLGYTIYRVYIKLQNTKPSTRHSIFEWICNQKETFYVAEIIGHWDIAVLFWAKDITEAEQFWNNYKSLYVQHTQHSLLSIFTKLHIFPRKYLGSKPDVVRVEPKSIPSLDKIDYIILQELASNSRASFVDIALKLKTTAKRIVYRVRKIEKEHVNLWYRAKLNYLKLQKHYFKVDMFLNDTTHLKSLYQFVFDNPNVIYINQTLGCSDFEFDVEIESFEELTSLLNKMSSLFPNTIRDYTYFQILKVHKIHYFPL